MDECAILSGQADGATAHERAHHMHAAGIDATTKSIDVTGLKQQAFAQILNAEEKHLHQSKELIDALRGAVAEMGN